MLLNLIHSENNNQRVEMCSKINTSKPLVYTNDPLCMYIPNTLVISFLQLNWCQNQIQRFGDPYFPQTNGEIIFKAKP